MLQVSPKSRDKIESVNREKESLFIKTERGMLRIDPKRADIIRIRYTRRENFQDGTGAGICQDRTISGWYHEVTEREILLFTERLTLHVSRSDAAIQHADRDGKVLLSEREKDPRELEEFDTYRIMEGAETWTEDVETADGIKRKVHDAPKVFDKKLYHTRLHLRFQEKECLYGLGQAEEGVLNLRGTVQYLHQANRKIAVPFMISSEGYGLLPASDIYDAFCGAARDLYWKQLEEGIFQYGTDGWWCDSSEPFTPEWARAEKPEPGQMYQDFVNTASLHIPAKLCNAYGLYHAQGIYEGQRNSGSQKRVVNLTRNGYTGQQRYGTILWSGDIEATWDTYRKQITAGLNFCASGLPYWTLDIGAFFVKRGVQ